MIILDRSYDSVAPLVHELTYQAMVYDVLDAEGDIVHLGARDVILDEHDDAVWRNYRHAHMATCQEELSTRFDELSKKKKNKFEGKPSAAQLSELMQQIPQYQKDIATLQLHMTLVDECDVHYDQRINDICDVEQDLVCDRQLTKKAAQKLIIPWLLNDEIGRFDKIRIILLYAINRNGIEDEELVKLVQHASLTSTDEAVIRNFSNFNISIIKNDNPTVNRMKRKDYSDDIKYRDSRYVPIIKDVMQVNTLLNTFTINLYPYCSILRRISWIKRYLDHSNFKNQKPKVQGKNQLEKNYIVY